MNNPIELHPNDDSYWVIPSRLIAGAYPFVKFNDDQTRRKLYRLLVAGVTSFLDLTGEGEMPPYEDLLKEQADWVESRITYRRIAIQDMGLPTEEQMKSTLDAIDEEIRQGRVVYVHCQAGIGRTGTVVGCYLVRNGLQGAEALNTIARLRAGTSSGWTRSPETDEQMEFVLNWQIGA